MLILSCLKLSDILRTSNYLCEGKEGFSSKNLMKHFFTVFVILIAFSLMTSLMAQETPETWMPDPNLRAIVRSRLSLAADVLLTQERLRELRTLTATDSGISTLTGLEHATRLIKLNLRDNSISDVDALSSLTRLERLYLDKNNISDVSPLSSLTNLKHLGLQDNNISDLSPLSSLKKLSGLGLGNRTSNVNGNNISDVSPLSNLKRLYWLYLQNNNISDVSALSSLTGLRLLDLSGNNISDVAALSSMKKLRWLYLQNSKISDVSPLSGLIELYWLYLQNNRISDVSPLAGLTNLAVLALHNNPILDTSPLYPLWQRQPFLPLVSIKVSEYPPWDINADGSVDATDSVLATSALGQSGEAIVDPRTDVNGDGSVDGIDLQLVIDNLDSENPAEGEGAAPSVFGGASDLLLDPSVRQTFDREAIAVALAGMQVESEGSLKYQRAIAFLESVLAMLHPAQTRLLANYPNPFNPETWIPYHLGEASDVRLRIYDINGSVVRDLELGPQDAGFYTSQSRAAYWDGKNDRGEKVSSGVYFYQLNTENHSFLRKMLIRK